VDDPIKHEPSLRVIEAGICIVILELLGRASVGCIVNSYWVFALMSEL
jgi:hypothetical protein